MSNNTKINYYLEYWTNYLIKEGGVPNRERLALQIAILLEAIADRDPAVLLPRVAPHNPVSCFIFQRETGMELPKTVKGIADAVKSYVDTDKLAALQEQEEARQRAAQAAEQAQKHADLLNSLDGSEENKSLLFEYLKTLSPKTAGRVAAYFSSGKNPIRYQVKDESYKIGSRLDFIATITREAHKLETMTINGKIRGCIYHYQNPDVFNSVTKTDYDFAMWIFTNMQTMTTAPEDEPETVAATTEETIEANDHENSLKTYRYSFANKSHAYYAADCVTWSGIVNSLLHYVSDIGKYHSDLSLFKEIHVLNEDYELHIVENTVNASSPGGPVPGRSISVEIQQHTDQDSAENEEKSGKHADSCILICEHADQPVAILKPQTANPILRNFQFPIFNFQLDELYYAMASGDDHGGLSANYFQGGDGFTVANKQQHSIESLEFRVESGVEEAAPITSGAIPASDKLAAGALSVKAQKTLEEMEKAVEDFKAEYEQKLTAMQEEIRKFTLKAQKGKRERNNSPELTEVYRQNMSEMSRYRHADRLLKSWLKNMDTLKPGEMLPPGKTYTNRYIVIDPVPMNLGGGLWEMELERLTYSKQYHDYSKNTEEPTRHRCVIRWELAPGDMLTRDNWLTTKPRFYVLEGE